MDRETIEKAAKEYASRHSDGFKPETGLEEEIFNAFQQASIKPFVDGAQWRINAVWHDTNELPKHSGYLAALMDNGLMETLHYTVGIGFHEMHLKGYTLWAYIDDLLPDGKEETK